jgi:hypothetical protein
MGITDKRWWERLVSWMMANPNRKLIIYSRADEKYFKRRIPTQVIRVREKVRRDFWKKDVETKQTLCIPISAPDYLLFSTAKYLVSQNVPISMKYR